MAELDTGMTTEATRPRPISPHLQIYRPMLTMVMSIVHRITGAALYFGMLLLAWWLVAAATGPNAYASVEWFMMRVPTADTISLRTAPSAIPATRGFSRASACVVAARACASAER